MNRLTHILLLTILITSGVHSFGQREDKVTFNEGVSAYKDGQYSDAQASFEAAYERNNKNTRALYNAGNAAYLNGDFESANKYFSDYAKVAKSPKEIAKAHFNQGNTYLQQADAMQMMPTEKQKAQELYQQAVKSFKNALKNNPTDLDAKYNLTYALDKIEKNEQNQDGEGNDQNQNQDQNGEGQDNQENQNGDNGENENNDSQDNQDSDENGDNQDQNQGDQNEDEKGDQGDEQEDKRDQQNDQENEGNQGDEGDQQEEEQSGQGGQGDQEQQEQQAQISRAQAEQDLDAINEEEEGILKKVYGSRNGGEKGKVNSGKDW